MDILFNVLKESWIITAKMAPYVIFGFFMAGLIKLFFNDQTILKFLGKDSKYAVFFAALLGVPMPLCSCGIVPVAASLKKSGASKGAVSSFLLSTPQTGIDSIFATYSLLGWAFAIWRPVQSFLMGIIGGNMVNLLDKEYKNSSIPEVKSCCQNQETEKTVSDSCCNSFQKIESNKCPHCKEEEISVLETSCPHCESEKEKITENSCCQSKVNDDITLNKIKKILHFAFIEMPSDLGKPMLLGLFLSGIISAFIAPDSLTNSFGGLFGQIGIALLVGIPLYVCSTASIPIAFTMVNAGFAPGAALVFLVTGPETNMAAMTVISKILGIKGFVIYLATVVILASLAGFLLNDFLTFSNISHIHHHHDTVEIWQQLCGAVLLFMLIFLSFLRNQIKAICK